jgi:glycosyltransferase involved in cell wall biosynthesis
VPNKILIICNTPIYINKGMYFTYGPYARELNVWMSNFEEVHFLSPLQQAEPSPLDVQLTGCNLQVISLPPISLVSPKEIGKAFFCLPYLAFVFWKYFRKFKKVHIRSPSNYGLLASLIQIFFPNTIKTVKYAGNWDPRSKQPFTYRLQQRIFKNRFLSKNIKILVYGNWEPENVNLVPFFTASYYESDIKPLVLKSLNRNTRVNCVFAGTLTSNKNPLMALQAAQFLRDAGFSIHLKVFGTGPLRSVLVDYIHSNNLHDSVAICGAQPLETITKAFQDAHFLFFFSDSEGWPKVVSEAMFWGCLPFTKQVSMVKEMVGENQRGFLVSDSKSCLSLIENLIENPDKYCEMQRLAADWSRTFTMNRFEQEIKKIID